MKTAQGVPAILLFCALFLARAGADPLSTQYDPTINPHALEDADGVPLSITHPTTVPTQDEIDASKKQQANDLQNKDWLMHSYEEQMILNHADKSSDKSSDLYYQIITDKNLSKMAGLNYLEAAKKDDATPKPDVPAGAGKPAMGLRTDAPEPSQSHVTSIFKPLITPLGAAEAGGLHNFYSSVASSSQALPPPPSDSVKVESEQDLVSDAAAMDMPGLTAAQSDPAKMSELTFDLPQDDALPQSNSRKQDDGTLPLSTNAALLQRQTSLSLGVPGSTLKTPAPVPINPVMIKLPSDLEPISTSAPHPIHPAIADPHDFITR